MRHTRSIIVGVDGTDSGHDALDWAAAEAATRHLPLRIVHAYAVAPSWAALGDVSLAYAGLHGYPVGEFGGTVQSQDAL
jgi:nucleotide-binding universal stress UspA family protein